jgi:transcriptional regulator with XRE-family HTH domain
MSETFGRRLRAYRKLKHWTQVELADRLGVSVAIVGTMERGVRQPTTEMIVQLCKTLQVSQEELGLFESDANGANHL